MDLLATCGSLEGCGHTELRLISSRSQVQLSQTLRVQAESLLTPPGV